MSERYDHTPSSTGDWSDCEPQPYADTPLPYVEQPSLSSHVEQPSPSIQQSTPLTEEAQPAAPRIHWTALVSCGVSACATLVFILDFLLRLNFDLPFLYALVFLLFSLIFAGMALALSFKPHWRKGRGIAIVGVLLPTLVLTLYGAFLAYVLVSGPPLF